MILGNGNVNSAINPVKFDKIITALSCIVRITGVDKGATSDDGHFRYASFSLKERTMHLEKSSKLLAYLSL